MDFDCYPLPSSYHRIDGTRRFAFITFVMRNDSYTPGALVFAFALRQQRTGADLVCLITSKVTSSSRSALEQIFDRVLEVEEVFIPHARRQERQDRPFLFTRFHALRAGPDGDLGLGYEKIVLVDADVLPMRCYDHLFTLETPAGIINESRLHSMEYNDQGRYIIPSSVNKTGKWNWHTRYEPLSPHGSRIPKDVTDRVLVDPGNMGVNSALWVLTPSLEIYNQMMLTCREPVMYELISRRFNWPEMQFATAFFSGQWTNLDLRFASFNGYPQLEVLCGTHFAGYKPWRFKDSGTIRRFSRFADYRLWQQKYLQMLDCYPNFHRFSRLARLANEINNLQR